MITSTSSQQIRAYNHESEQAVCQWEVHEECKAQTETSGTG